MNPELTVDFIMIVGKYLESNDDYINLMKVCKKYRELVGMYKYNPISDISLFESIQTQHFYKNSDLKTALPHMYRYKVETIVTENEICAIGKCNKYTNYQVKENDTDDIADRIELKNMKQAMVNRILANTPYDLDGLLGTRYDMPILHYLEDKFGNSLVAITYYRLTKYPTVKLLYRSRENEYYDFNEPYFRFRDSTGLFKIVDNKDGYITTAVRRSKGEYVLEINSNMNKEFLMSTLFSRVRSFKNFSSIKNRVGLRVYERYALRDLTLEYPEIHSKYYTQLLGRYLNVLIDSCTLRDDRSFEYNIGYARHIYIDREKNHIIFNILPNEIIITVRIGEKIRVYKPKCDMSRIIDSDDMNRNGIWDRVTINKYLLDEFYAVTLNEMIEPLQQFIPVRKLVATNEYTRYSFVKDGRYVVKVVDNELETVK